MTGVAWREEQFAMDFDAKPHMLGAVSEQICIS
eukprot:CAMPEP_0172853226 /NCGR_PEP_ID=MMETSP1075-20121228/56392_1 /TAXON_ID=2916 /ORGANISM="Ceratium fusus, Strain PA161109" /LENGTH=32 /DNA_ID= /DNA_START= /DNA_END= /DNA_ORIENTATION=